MQAECQKLPKKMVIVTDKHNKKAIPPNDELIVFDQ